MAHISTSSPPDKPFMTLKAPNGVGKVFYTIGRNMDAESAEKVLSFYKELHPESDLAPFSDPRQGVAGAPQAARSGPPTSPRGTKVDDPLPSSLSPAWQGEQDFLPCTRSFISSALYVLAKLLPFPNS
jgi:hypothetical protein